MLDHIMHYQFGFYGSGTHLDAEPGTIADLLNAFRDKGLIPTTIPEIQLTPNLKSRPQLQFITPDEQWRLAFEAKRILLRKQSLPNQEVGDSRKFADEVNEIFEKLLRIAPIVGNRLSYVVKGLFPESSSERLKSIKPRVLRDIPFYETNPPNRWETKCVTRVTRSFGKRTELLNVLTDINRVQGEFNEEDGATRPFDRIQTEVDINTSQDDVIARFDYADIEPFLSSATQLSWSLVSEVGAILDD